MVNDKRIRTCVTGLVIVLWAVVACSSSKPGTVADADGADVDGQDVPTDTTPETKDTPETVEIPDTAPDEVMLPEECQWFQQCGVCGECDDGDPCTQDRCLPCLTCGHVPLQCQCESSCGGPDGRLVLVQALNQGVGGLAGLEGIRDVLLSADGRDLYVAATESGAVTQLQEVDGQWLWASSVDTSAVTGVALSGDGATVFAASEEGIVALARDAETGALSSPTIVGSTTQRLAAWGDRLVAVEDEELRLYQWDGTTLNGGDPVQHDSLNGAANAIFSSDGTQLIVAAYHAGALSVWGVSDAGLAHLQTLSGQRGLNSATDVAIAPDGAHVYVTSMCDHDVAILTRDATDGTLTWVGSAHSDVPIPPDCELVFDQEPTDNPEDEMPVIYPTSVAVSPDGSAVVVAAALGMALIRYAPDGDALTLTDRMLDPPPTLDFNASSSGQEGLSSGWVDTMRWSGSVAAGQGVALLGSQVTGAVAVVGEGDPVFVQHGMGGVVDLAGAYNLGISPDDRHVYVASRNHHTVASFSIDAKEGFLTPIPSPELSFVDPWRRSLLRVTVTRPDGAQVLAVSGDESSLYVLDRDEDSGVLTYVSTTPLPDCNGYPAFPVDVVCAPDGQSVYAADFQFDIDTPGCLYTLQRQADGSLGAPSILSGNYLNGLESIVFSSDGKDVYTAAHLAAAVTHLKRDPDTGDLTQAVPIVEEPLFGVEMIAIAPDDRHLYAGNPVMSNITVFERDENTGSLTLIQEVGPDGEGLLNNAAGVTVSPDGTHVYVAARVDGSINIYGRGQDGTLSFEGVESRPSLDWINGLAITSDNRFLIGAAVNASAVTTFSIVTGDSDGCGGVCP